MREFARKQINFRLRPRTNRLANTARRDIYIYTNNDHNRRARRSLCGIRPSQTLKRNSKVIREYLWFWTAGGRQFGVCGFGLDVRKKTNKTGLAVGGIGALVRVCVCVLGFRCDCASVCSI